MKVRCAFCSSVISHWEQGDVVEQEHRRSCPRCPFVLGQNVGNIPCPQVANGYHPNSQSVSLYPINSSRGYDIPPSEDRSPHRLLAQNDHRHAVHDARVDRTSIPMIVQMNGLTGGGMPNGAPAEHVYQTRPQNQSMATEPARLSTFETWPGQMQQKPEVMAKAGLYYTGE